MSSLLLSSPLLTTVLTTPSCPIRNGTKALIFSDVTAGTGEFSSQWEHHFWDWWAANTSSAPPHQFLSLSEFSACSSEDLLGARALFMPGGNAYTYTQHLGVKGKNTIRAFMRGGGKYIGTCAGWYYASKGYFWEYDTHWSDAGYWHYSQLLKVFDAEVEGSVTDISDEETADGVFDGHAVANLSSGHRAIYYGGPTVGWRHTNEVNLPQGTLVIARFTGVQSQPPAIVRVIDSRNQLLLFSVHLEAYEGIGVTELTAVQRQANYALRAKLIQEFLAS